MSESEGKKRTGVVYGFDSFLKKNQHLFTLIGVFGTVSVYLSDMDYNQPDNQIPISNFAMFFGLGITVLLSIIVIYKTIDEIFGNEKRTIEKIPYLVFAVLFSILLYIIVIVLSGYQGVIFAIVVTVSLYVGVILPVLPILIVDKLEYNLPHSQSPIILSIYSYSLMALFMFLTNSYLGGYSLSASQVNQLPPENYHMISMNLAATLAAGTSALLFFISIFLAILSALKLLYAKAVSYIELS